MKPYDTSCKMGYSINLNCCFRGISGCHHQMGVSKNRGTPKSSILIGFSIILTIHFGGTHIFGNIQIVVGFPRVSFPPNRRKEADWMPGLVLDLYGSVGVCGFDGLGSETFWRPRWPGQPKMGSKVWGGGSGLIAKKHPWNGDGYPNLILLWCFFAHHHF